MGLPGGSDGIRRFTAVSVAMIGFLFLLEGAGLVQEKNPIGKGIEGFRELRWGTSIEQAFRIYPDLYFEKYVISNSREEPWKVYVRKSEHAEIENVAFDSIEYWFKEDHFFQVRAILQSRIGPRTLLTRAENAFDKISQRFKNQYGDPSDLKTDYITEFIVVVKEATWIVNRSTIRIKYEGTGRTNEDLMTLTMREAQ